MHLFSSPPRAHAAVTLPEVSKEPKKATNLWCDRKAGYANDTEVLACALVINAPGADVRKAAVDGLVDVYRALGDGVVPKFKQFLRDDQVRLVGTYVHRAGLSAGA